MHKWLKRPFLLLFLGVLISCQRGAPLGESFKIQRGDDPVSVADSDLEIRSCGKGEDFSEDGGDVWVGMSGTYQGQGFSRETYGDSVSVDIYEIEIVSADLFGNCTLVVRLAKE